MRPSQRVLAQPGKAEFVGLAAVLMSIIALSVDIMLPAFGAITDHFALQNDNDRQAMITVIFVGLMIGQLIFGPLSDTIGRKPAILIGLAIHIVGTLLCIFANDYAVLLLGRFLQGLGGAGPRIVIVAMVRDRFEGKAMAEIISYALTVFVLIPTFAPAVGQLILAFAPWQAVFASLLVVATIGGTWLALRQPETHINRQPFHAGRFFAAIKETLSTPVSVLFATASGCVFGTLLGYVVSSQQIWQDLYGTGELFAFFFGISALSIALATLVNTRLLKLTSMERINLIAIAVQILWSFGWLMWIWFGPGTLSLTAWTVFICIGLFLVGLTFGNFNAIALKPLGHIAGIASSVTASIQTLISVIAAATIGAAFNMTVTPVIVGALVTSIASLGLMIAANRLSNTPL